MGEHGRLARHEVACSSCAGESGQSMARVGAGGSACRGRSQEPAAGQDRDGRPGLTGCGTEPAPRGVRCRTQHVQGGGERVRSVLGGQRVLVECGQGADAECPALVAGAAGTADPAAHGAPGARPAGPRPRGGSPGPCGPARGPPPAPCSHAAPAARRPAARAWLRSRCSEHGRDAWSPGRRRGRVLLRALAWPHGSQHRTATGAPQHPAAQRPPRRHHVHNSINVHPVRLTPGSRPAATTGKGQLVLHPGPPTTVHPRPKRSAPHPAPRRPFTPGP
jgi:hypothetical protein